MTDSMRHIVALSGGKDSTALALYLRDRLKDPEYVFADTGRELPELYAFLDRLEEKLGKIHRITDGWYCSTCKIYGVDPELKNCPDCQGPLRQRNFDYYLYRWSSPEDGPLLPGPAWRWCTKHLKLRPFDRFVGKDEATVYIGLRSDESDRAGNYGDRPNVRYSYPFVEDGVDRKGVMSILATHGIDLPDFYRWRSTGGCWCCPFQRKSDWVALCREHPRLFEQAKREETASKYQWRRGTSLVQIQGIASQKEMFPEMIDWRDSMLQDSLCLICAK